MKKLVVLLILAVAGYNIYTHYFTFPLLGEWQPDKDAFMQRAYAQGVTAEQEQLLLTALDKLRLSITDDKITIRLFERSGEFDYEAKKSRTDCYTLDIKGLGTADACLKEGKLEMTNVDTGVVETFNKVT